MKPKTLKTLLAILAISIAQNMISQEKHQKFDWYLIGGLNIGATAPVPFPSSHLDIKSVKIKINPQLGTNIIYNINEKWGLGTGLTVDWKSMNVNTKVHDVHSSITIPSAVEDIPAGSILNGHIEGRSNTKTNLIYLTQPIFVTYKFNQYWQIRAGGYISEALKRNFNGSVTQVKIIADKINGNPVSGLEKEIPYATYDFSNNVRKIELGLLAGGEYKLNNKLGIYANFTWALNPFFSGENPVDFTTRNIFGNIGVSYRLK